MPCRTDPMPTREPQVNKSKLDNLERKLTKRLDRLTRMLCSTLRWMEEHDCNADSIDEFFSNNREVKAWWKEHKSFDEAREIADSLSPQQKMALLRVLKEDLK